MQAIFRSSTCLSIGGEKRILAANEMTLAEPRAYLADVHQVSLRGGEVAAPSECPRTVQWLTMGLSVHQVAAEVARGSATYWAYA